MDQITGARLTDEELAAVVAASRVPIASHSPLAGVQPASAEMPRSLISKGVVLANGTVSRAWRQALATLGAPAGLFSLYLCDDSSWQSADIYYAHGLQVSCSGGDGDFQIGFPVPGAVVLDLARVGLGLGDVPELDLPTIDLTVAEFSALAAIVDAGREEVFRAQIDRRSPELAAFAWDQLVSQLEAIQTQDVRWFSCLADASLPESHRPSGIDLVAGLQSLEARGLVTTGQAQEIVPAPLVSEVCAALLVHTAYLTVFSVEGGNVNQRLLFVRAGVGIWAVECWADQENAMVRLHGLGGPAAEQLLWDCCLATEGWKMVPPTTVMADQLTPDQRARFATPAAISTPTSPSPRSTPPSPPTPASPPSAVCANPSCRQPLKPGKRFCAACGTPIA